MNKNKKTQCEGQGCDHDKTKEKKILEHHLSTLYIYTHTEKNSSNKLE